MANTIEYGQGAVNNTIGWGQGAKVGGSSFTNTLSTRFDGIDDFVDCGDADNLSFGNGSTDSPFSISAWVKMTDVTNSSILSKTNISPSHYEYSAHFNLEQIYFGVYSQDSNANYLFVNYATNLTSYEGSWIHLAFTYDGNSNINGLKIYLNGQRVDDTQFTSGTYVSMNNTIAPLKIGRSFNNRFLNGLIDETAIFSSELSASDVSSIYGSGVPSDLSTYSSLVSWWRMGDSDTFPTLSDNKGSNDGTMTNMTSGNIVSDVPT